MPSMNVIIKLVTHVFAQSILDNRVRVLMVRQAISGILQVSMRRLIRRIHKICRLNFIIVLRTRPMITSPLKKLCITINAKASGIS